MWGQLGALLCFGFRVCSEHNITADVLSPNIKAQKSRSVLYWIYYSVIHYCVYIL